jgi:hypothetical protein
MDQQPMSYFERRERIERAAAKNAACPNARRAHQELAQRYAELAREQNAPALAQPPAPRRRLTILAY